MEKIYFNGFKQALKKFADTDCKETCSYGNWLILKGKADVWFEVYYKSLLVVECINGTLECNCDIEHSAKISMFKKIIDIFDHLEYNEDDEDYDFSDYYSEYDYDD